MKLKTVLVMITGILLLCVPVTSFAFTLTITQLSDYNTYFGKADVPPMYGGAATTEKVIPILWSASISNGTWYINIDSSTPNDPVHQVDNGSGTYYGGARDFNLGATQIIENSDVPTAVGRKAVYVILVGDPGGVDGGVSDGGGGGTQPQNPITPVFVYFKLDPPAGNPVITNDGVGDSNVKLTMDWSSVSNPDDKGGFKVYYRVKDSGSQFSSTDEIFVNNYQLGGLTNLTEYEIYVTQLDKARNESLPSASVYAMPVPVADYYTYYKLNDGQEDGGFCFIATAAFGSPLHPFVHILREFRDRYLLTNAPGRVFVKLYYHSSPPAAEIIRHNRALSLVSRIALSPMVVFAWLSLHPVFPILGIAFTLLAAAYTGRRRRGGKLFGKLFLFLLAFSALVLTANPARAESPRNWAFELKFGPYYPTQIDSEKGLIGRPYQEIFGYSYGLMSQIQVDYIFWQKMGSLSIGGGFGFWQTRGKGMAYNPSTGEVYKSSDTTVFNMIPLTLVMTYRFDWFALKKGVPLVPFVKLGLDYYVWWVLNGLGNVPDFDNGKGSGGKFGWHATVGLAFLLDFIDPGTANDLDVSTGINHTYLFAEWTYSKVDNFNSKGFRLGSEYFLFGLLFEF